MPGRVVADVIIGDLLSPVVALVGAYVVVGAVALVTGWHVFRENRPQRYRRGVRVPPVGGTGHDGGGVR